MLNIVLFGPPGAGKGTQSEGLIEKYGLTHLSTGDLFRKNISEGTDLGNKAQTFMDEGNLVPDEVVVGMVEQKIGESGDVSGFIFDGFPRTESQAASLDSLMNKIGHPISCMISLNVPDDELRARLTSRAATSGRVDDQDPEKINNRIRVYYDETEPVINYYQKQNKHHEVKGIGQIEEIFHTLTKVIDLL